MTLHTHLATTLTLAQRVGEVWSEPQQWPYDLSQPNPTVTSTKEHSLHGQCCRAARKGSSLGRACSSRDHSSHSLPGPSTFTCHLLETEAYISSASCHSYTGWSCPHLSWGGQHSRETTCTKQGGPHRTFDCFWQEDWPTLWSGTFHMVIGAHGRKITTKSQNGVHTTWDTGETQVRVLCIDQSVHTCDHSSEKVSDPKNSVSETRKE